MSSSPLTVVLSLLLCAGASALIGAGCGDDETPTRSDGGAGFPTFPDGSTEEVSPMANCPPTPPKDGENCPAVTESRLSCTFVVGVCEQPLGSYDITVDYCCGKGETWTLCGANTTPCDQPADAGAPD